MFTSGINLIMLKKGEIDKIWYRCLRCLKAWQGLGSKSCSHWKVTIRTSEGIQLSWGAPEIVGSIFQIGIKIVTRWSRLDQQTVGVTSLNVFNSCRVTTIKTRGWVALWTNPLSPEPPWVEFPTREDRQGKLRLLRTFYKNPTCSF